jgi:hypothetical protein
MVVFGQSSYCLCRTCSGNPCFYEGTRGTMDPRNKCGDDSLVVGFGGGIYNAKN